MSRPLMTAVAAQQATLDAVRRQLDVQNRQIAHIARLAGITDDIAKIADINNPAQPIPDSPEQAPSETSEQATAPETNDDVRAPGQTGGSADHVPATATDLPIQPGGTLPAAPYNNLTDVTAPVAGTNTGEIPPEETRIESDVRVNDPMVPDVAFPWTISPNESNDNPPADGEMAQGKQANRSFASLRLARLRIEAGIARGDDLALGAAIESDKTLTSEAISREIEVLASVTKAATRRTAKTAQPGSVPRRASKTARTAPSLASPSSGLQATASTDDSMLFLSDGDLSGL